MIVDELEKTPRREAREGYVRYILSKANIEVSDIEEFLTTKQTVLENHSPLELIYSGEYEKAVDVVEKFVDEWQILQEVEPV